MNADKDIHAVYAVVGHDRLLTCEALNAILERVGDAMDETGPVRLDGASVTVADVLDDVRTMSLLGERRVVIVDDADKLLADAERRKLLERYCEDPCSSGTLVLMCGALPSNRRLYKIIAKTGSVQTCTPPKGAAAARWVTSRARTEYGKSIVPQAVNMLRDRIGDDAGMLDAELSKLSDFVGSRPGIEADDVEAMTGRTREEKVFGVINSVIDGDAEGALTQWRHVLDTDRAAEGRAIAGLSWALRSLIDAREQWESGTPIGSLSRRAFTDPDSLKRRFEAAPLDLLIRQQRDLLEFDAAAKSGGTTVPLAVEKFIVRYAAPGRASAR